MHGISSRTDWGWCRCAGHGWPERSTPRSTSAQRCHGVHPCRYTTITTWNDPGRTIQTMGYLAHLRVKVPMCADVMFWLRAYSLVHSTVQRVSWWSPNQNCGSMVPFGGVFFWNLPTCSSTAARRHGVDEVELCCFERDRPEIGLSPGPSRTSPGHPIQATHPWGWRFSLPKPWGWSSPWATKCHTVFSSGSSGVHQIYDIYI